jgi:hypothetical protein
MRSVYRVGHAGGSAGRWPLAAGRWAAAPRLWLCLVARGHTVLPRQHVQHPQLSNKLLAGSSVNLRDEVIANSRHTLPFPLLASHKVR